MAKILSIADKINAIDLLGSFGIFFFSSSKNVLNPFFINILFNTYIPEENIDIKSNIKLDNVMIPTLYIKNKRLFDELLSTYLKLAVNFYDDKNYYIDITENTFNYYKVKTLLSILWSNATYEDFNDPINFLRRRITFFKNNLTDYNNWCDLGYSENLNSNIKVKNTKSNLRNETPYKLEIYLDNDDGKYELPNIYYGIENEKIEKSNSSSFNSIISSWQHVYRMWKQ